MKNSLLLLIAFVILVSCDSSDPSGDPPGEEISENRLTIEEWNPYRPKLGEVVTFMGNRMDLIKEIEFYTSDNAGPFDTRGTLTRNSFIAQTESELSFKIPYVSQKEIMIDFLNVDKTVKKLSLRGWILVEHDFERIDLIKTRNSKIGYVFDGKTVHKSEDGFETWRPYFQSENHIGRIFFIDDNLGWIVEEDYGLDKSIFHITEDGGKSFNVQFEVSNKHGRQRRVHFFSKDKGIFIIDTRMYVFENGELVEAFDYFPELDSGMILNEEIFDFTVIDENKIFIHPNLGNLLLLNDGKLSDVGIESHFEMRPQMFDDIGYSLGGYNNHFYKSTDGGLSWTQIHTFDGPYTSFYFLDKNHGFVKTGSGGNKGVLLETTDGGANWMEIPDGLQFVPGISEVDTREFLIWNRDRRQLYRYVE